MKHVLDLVYVSVRYTTLVKFSALQIPYPRERGPTMEYWPTPQFGVNFLLRSNVTSNMRPCVAALHGKRKLKWLVYED